MFFNTRGYSPPGNLEDRIILQLNNDEYTFPDKTDKVRERTLNRNELKMKRKKVTKEIKGKKPKTTLIQHKISGALPKKANTRERMKQNAPVFVFQAAGQTKGIPICAYLHSALIRCSGIP